MRPLRLLPRHLAILLLAGAALVAVPVAPANAADVPCQRTFESGPVNRAIPDNGTVPSFIDVPEDGLVVADADVKVNIHHTVDNSVFVSLLAVDDRTFDTRTEVVLFDRGGGSGDNLLGTVFDDEAANPVTWGDPPFTGRFKPTRPLSGVDGLTGGEYGLIAGDHDAGIGLGTLDDWSVTFTYRACDFDTDGVEDHADRCRGVTARTATGCPATSRRLSASYRSGGFRGVLSSPVRGCEARTPVTVFRARSGRDARVGTTRTRADGSWRLLRAKRPGRYYATAPRAVVPGVAECAAVTSTRFRTR